MGPRLRTLLLVFLAVALVGCFNTARRKVDGDVVRDIDFAGNGDVLTKAVSGQSNYLLRGQMSAAPAPFGAFMFPFTYFMEVEPFHRDVLAKDAYRLEVWYAHHGWFDAQVLGWEMRRVHPQRKRKAGVVDVTGIVEPGRRSVVGEFEIRGLTGPAQKVLGNTVERTGLVQPGEPFDLQFAFATRDQLIEELSNYGFAYATATISVDAFPDEGTVKIGIDAQAGIDATFGPITITGNEAIDSEVIADALRITEGEAYRIDSLRLAQRNLFELGLFSVATVTPRLDDPTQKAVPIDVTVDESLFRTVRVGAGFDYDGAFKPRVSSTFRHMNLFGDLVRFELRGAYGYTSVSSGRREVVAKLRLDLSQPRLFGSSRFGILGSVGVDRDLQSGEFPYLNPSAGVTVNWRGSRQIVVSFGPRWELYRYLNFEGPVAFAAGTLFGGGFKNPYTLTTFDVNVVVDRRDDALAPTRGWHGAFGVRQAVPFDADDFLYTEGTLDGRVYFKFKNPSLLQHVQDDESTPTAAAAGLRALGRAVLPEIIAMRGATKLLVPLAGRPLPYPELAFLGGATNMRGFRTDQIGPYDAVCLYQPARGSSFDVGDALATGFRRYILGQSVRPNSKAPGDPFTSVPGTGQDVQQIYLPKGGQVSALVSLEARYDALFGLTFVAFTDVGLLNDTLKPRDFAVSDVRLAYGGGLRYASKIGPIRADLAFRPLYPEDWGPRQYVNCRVGDRVPRPFDLMSLSREQRDLARRGTPFAVNLFFGIGEAI